MRTWNRTEAERLTETPRRRILFYAERPGLLTGIKSAGEDQGQGIKREYTDQNIVELVLIRELSDTGFALTEIISILSGLRMAKPNWWNVEQNGVEARPFCIVLTRSRRGGWLTKFEDGDFGTVKTDRNHLIGIVVNIGRLIESIDWSLA